MTSHTPSLYANHSRQHRENRFVYPVLSRRSQGISVGINLNPDKVCNFDCIYCQVNRQSEAETLFVNSGRLKTELEEMLKYVASGAIFRDEPFANVAAPLQRFNDIAFSGDGEPTTFRNFADIVRQVADRKRAYALDEVKLVLITNASMFHRPAVRQALEHLDQNNGEVWAKLEAGTDEYYRLIERTKIPFRRVLDNITAAAQVRPLVIQSLFMRIEGDPPPAAEISAFCGRLNAIRTAGGRIKLVQVYTVARRPAEDFVAPLSDGEVDQIAAEVVNRTGLTVEPYYGGAA
jgi:wyosine [tRNA(Phe)-imidazoG37] synthetase (radical SAM superfamily)